jgi:hypothetical protein
MALAQTDLPELRRFTFFVSRRFEEGRERFRLHMGYFATLAEAEEWLGVVRDIYPGAWAGEAPGRKLRERAAAAAAAQAQHAAGPQPHAPPTVARAPLPPRAAPVPSAAAPVHPGAMKVPVVHAAPPVAPLARPPAAPPVVRPAARPLSAAAPPTRPAQAPGGSAARPATPPRAAIPAAPRLPAPPAPPATATRPATAAAPRHPATPPTRTAQGPRIQAGTATAPVRAPQPPASRPGVKPVFEDSNVREVLKALGDASATGETRLMRAPPPPPPPREATPENSSLSDTQVLKLLETRRAEGGDTPPAELTEGGIPLLKPDDTGTRRALKEAVASNAPVAFAVQLQWSVQPVELDKVPPLAIFSAYTLYTVEGSRDGRKWYGLRLGFFSDAISAKQVAYYVRSEFTSVAVVPVSPQEKSRATDQDMAATLAAPAATRVDAMDEFKLIDDDSTTHGAAAASPAAPTPPAGAVKTPAKAAPRVAVGRALSRSSAPPPRPRTRSGKVGAREHRGPHTLEETLEILGASQLSIDQGSGETLNDTGVRHLRVEVQRKNSPFSKLLERLSERLKKP